MFKDLSILRPTRLYFKTQGIAVIEPVTDPFSEYLTTDLTEGFYSNGKIWVIEAFLNAQKLIFRNSFIFYYLSENNDLFSSGSKI